MFHTARARLVLQLFRTSRSVTSKAISNININNRQTYIPPNPIASSLLNSQLLPSTPHKRQITNMALTNPTATEALALFQEIEQKFPSATLGDDKWYILAVCSPLEHGHFL
jgi:hypothetical protein